MDNAIRSGPMTRCSVPPLDDGKDGASTLPAFIIDAAAGAIVAANAAGRKAWGLGAVPAPVAIDRAMPALRQLAPLARSGGRGRLVFWAATGLLALDCRVEPRAAGTYLVRALPGGAGAIEGKTGTRTGAVIGANGGAGAGAGNGVDGSRLRPAAGPRLGAAEMEALARLAHEIRTPLSAAIAYAEVLKEEHFGPLAHARYRDYARAIYDSARHALGVVDGMLASAPGGSGLPELAFTDLDPASVIDNCLAVARPLAEQAGLALVAHFSRATPRVIADEVSLKQMLLNLITNAIKFARPGDRVTLGTVYGADGCLRIEVADTGPGMDTRLRSWRDAAAAAGRSAGRGDAGLGIGLPLTRALAEANGAALIVDSAPGRGTRVTIAFGKDRVVPV